ncbi:alpha-L-fucosidase [Pseudoclostridium thermosuccinogenes]|uniref:alpha-L-fucosidase n=1 Tax=Clostridium thermosuccinogenes TaxID=84032 RepID=UPI000CCC3AFE|nr:alpha-L-fucosidase [Pseudoclostridium thermosuccinogenes]PNT93469.1 alpha-L-fucosidase [Pseudoclostridium thermosuccinogenes]
MADKVNQGVHNYTDKYDYIAPEDPLVRERLEWFKDQKLGLMMHWGPYCQLGVVESWALSDKDGSWSRNGIDWVDGDMELFKQQYIDLNKTFNPVRFMPDQWAKIAKEGGFKYLIFTTKHHDGFCMWDTKTTDYKITGKDCPYRNNKYADIVKHLFNAFRNEGLGIAAYFSKADWHSEYYWAEGHEHSHFKNRNTTYNTKEYPELWNKFVEYTHEQLRELLTDYGKVDILWLDAGWVCPQNNQDIRLYDIIEEIRRTTQPGLIVADRTVGGVYENYVTPEQTVPDEPMDIPWESCITLGTSFSFAYGDDYKPLRQVAHLLIDIVAKGGNLALNVGPQPDGRLPRQALRSIHDLGQWLKVYGDAIYGTRPCAPYRTGNFAFTKKGGKVYAFYLYSDENQELITETTIPVDFDCKSVTLMGSGERISFKRTAEGIKVTVPHREGKTPVCDVFVLSDEEG